MTSQHITRCDKELGTFCGWRFGITRFKQSLVRYFSDIEYGSAQNALREAESFREHIYNLLAQNPGKEADILQQLDAQYRRNRELPATLRRYTPSSTQRKAITIRISPQLNQALDHYSSFIGLEPSSVVRLALYHYFTLIAGLSESPSPADLQQHVAELEAQATALGLPSFAALMSNEPCTARHQTEYPAINDSPLMAADEEES